MYSQTNLSVTCSQTGLWAGVFSVHSPILSNIPNPALLASLSFSILSKPLLHSLTINKLGYFVSSISGTNEVIVYRVMMYANPLLIA